MVCQAFYPNESEFLVLGLYLFEFIYKLSETKDQVTGKRNVVSTSKQQNAANYAEVLKHRKPTAPESTSNEPASLRNEGIIII